MKKVVLLLGIAVAFVQYACNNNTNSTENQAKMEQERQDSIRKADSTKVADQERMERENYRNAMDRQIDSLKHAEDRADSMYDVKKDKDKAALKAAKDEMDARIDRLKKRRDEAGSVTKDNWSKFKEEVDTAMQNMKSGWDKSTGTMKRKTTTTTTTNKK